MNKLKKIDWLRYIVKIYNEDLWVKQNGRIINTLVELKEEAIITVNEKAMDIWWKAIISEINGYKNEENEKLNFSINTKNRKIFIKL